MCVGKGDTTRIQQQLEDTDWTNVKAQDAVDQLIAILQKEKGESEESRIETATWNSGTNSLQRRPFVVMQES